MTAVSLSSLLEETSQELDRLRRGYAQLWRDDPSSSTRRLFAETLRQREEETITALERYRERDEHRGALGTYVRLAAAFPHDASLEWPERPELDDIISFARASDDALDKLSERIKLYASGGELHEALEAFEEIVLTRQKRLADALRELDTERTEPPAPS